jgi:hypothetical protein
MLQDQKKQRYRDLRDRYLILEGQDWRWEDRDNDRDDG